MFEVVERLLHELAGLDPRVRYPVVGVMVTLETTVFIGLVVLGDVVVLLAGSTVTGPGRFALLAGIAAAGSLAGETVGYLLGRQYGQRLRSSRLGRRLGEHRWAAAEAFLNGRGGRAVFAARFVAMVHAVLPVVAGTVRMPYWRFIGWCGAGSVVWSLLYVAAGAAAGASWLDPAVVATVRQRGAVEAEHSFAVEFGAAGARLLRQLPAGEPQHHQLLHAYLSSSVHGQIDAPLHRVVEPSLAYGGPASSRWPPNNGPGLAGHGVAGDQLLDLVHPQHRAGHGHAQRPVRG